MICGDAKLSLGAYVLDALDPRERAEIDVHLRACVACRAELAELVTLPPLLARLSLQDLGESVPPAVVPDELFDKVVASVRDADGTASGRVVTWLRRRPAQALLAAAAAVALLGGGIATTVVLNGGSSSPDTHVAISGPVRMQVTLTSQQTGTALAVAVSGLPVDEHCWLVAYADDGSRASVGRWVATYAGEARVTGSTTIPVAELSKLVLLGSDGTPLVTMNV